MANSCEKLIIDAKLLIALWENSATNVKRSNVVDCIDNGADINVRFTNYSNNTPLHIAVVKGDREILNILLRYGAKTNIENDEGKTALDLAREMPDCSDIAEILLQNDRATETAMGPVVEDVRAIDAVCKYKKRSGTAGVRGQLYETKLLTLIYLRVYRCRHIKQFYMGTNMDEIGEMDDVCLRFKTVNDDYVIFLQAKHKHDIVKNKVRFEDLWQKSGDFSLLKYFGSYRKIRDKFDLNSDNEIFRGRYEDMKRYYVMYTTVKDDIEPSRKKSTLNDEVMNLIATGAYKNVFQLKHDEQYIDVLTKSILIERLRYMGHRLYKLIEDNKPEIMLCDENIRSFHVMLAQKVIKVSEVNTQGLRTGIFREEFFSSNEELLIVLRETLYIEAVRTNSLSTEEITASVMKISCLPDKESISVLIGSILTYDSKTNALKLNDQGNINISTLQWLLDPLQVPQSVINEAFDLAGQRKLRSLMFGLPVAFGNLDLTLHKNKAEKRLKFLATKISDIVNESQDAEGNVVIREGMYATNKRLTMGELAINGGIASAVGNLLVLDDKNNVKFNLDEDTLGENAKKLLLMLKERLNDLHKYRLKLESENLPRLSLQATEYEKSFVTDYFDNLYFYTCQAKEDQLEGIGTTELKVHEWSDSFDKSESHIKSNAVFLKVHNEIQIWWMTEQMAPYLTRNTFDHIFRDFINKSLLTFLNFIYLKKMNNVGIEFNPDAIDLLSVCGRDTCNLIVIHTDVHQLTCHKLVQYFKDTEDYIFIDIEYLSRLSVNFLNMIADELAQTNNIKIVVIICEELTKYNDVIIACGDRRKILVTSNKNFAPEEGCILLRDTKINLTDLTSTSQYKLLQTQFSYHGIEVTLAEVFDEEMKHLVKAKIVEKIINKEYITLGQPLALSTYEEIKHYYVPRTLQRNKRTLNYTSGNSDEDLDYNSSECESEDYSMWSNKKSTKKFLPSTLIDHHTTWKRRQKKQTYGIILIIDTPGMGKSTLLTHLSLETKRLFPKIWIQRINLIDHTKQFHEWHEKKVEVDSLEALKFVCKVVMSKELAASNIMASYGNNNLDLEIINDEIKLINRESQSVLGSFELDIFLYCFNKRQIIFLFDGFDEVCPHYKREVMQLLKYLARRIPKDEDMSNEGSEHENSQQCVWITSRPYNDLRQTLEKEFGESYTLEPFTYKDIRVFLDKYLRYNLDISTLNSNQLKNISGFFEYMETFDLFYNASTKNISLVNIPLHSIYVAAMEYFKSEIKRSHVTDNNLIYVKDWDINLSQLIAWLKHLNNYERLNDVLTLSSVPLHVYIAIHYFQSQVKDTMHTDAKEYIKQWDLDTNAFAFYDRFIEMKLKTIRFEEKNRMDIYNPDIKITYEKEKKDFLDKHKKLAFYSVCSKTIFTNDEVVEIKEIIKRMENGEEKTGLVDRIVDGKAKFVHYTFAEYFAVEYILDSLKSSDSDKQQGMVNYIMYTMVSWATKGILDLFDLKIKFDSVLVNAMNTSQVCHSIFEALVYQSNVEYEPDVYYDYVGNVEDLTATALDNVVRYGMIHFTAFMIDALISTIDETNFSDFMSLVEKGTFFKGLIVANRDELVGKILDCIRRFDSSRIDDIFPYSLFEERIHSRSNNEEFIEAYHQKLLHEYYLSLLPSPNRRHMSCS